MRAYPWILISCQRNAHTLLCRISIYCIKIGSRSTLALSLLTTVKWHWTTLWIIFSLNANKTKPYFSHFLPPPPSGMYCTRCIASATINAICDWISAGVQQINWYIFLCQKEISLNRFLEIVLSDRPISTIILIMYQRRRRRCTDVGTRSSFPE